MILIFFVVAIGLHLAVNEYGFQHHHEGMYQGLGQWLLALAVISGAAVGFVFDVGDLGRHVLFALLTGGIVLNIVKEEVSDEQSRTFSAFTIGASTYASLLLAL